MARNGEMGRVELNSLVIVRLFEVLCKDFCFIVLVYHFGLLHEVVNSHVLRIH